MAAGRVLTWKLVSRHPLMAVVMHQRNRARLCCNSTGKQRRMVTHGDDLRIDADIWLAVFRSHCSSHSTLRHRLPVVHSRSENATG